MVEGISSNKAVANDMVEDTTLFDAIKNSEEVAKMFTHLWDKDVLNSRDLKRCLSGRLVPLNKVHPSVPTRREMRPIVALSPVVKLMEVRLKAKLDQYMEDRMHISQIGFVRGCGTHLNIVRLVRHCLERKHKSQRMAVLFIDFESAYNNVHLEELFKILKNKKILFDEEINFLRSLYSNMNITVGKQKVKIYKGVMQGSILSPALFNIFLEPLLVELSNELGYKQVLAYADDLAICINSLFQLNEAARIVRDWCTRMGVPLNTRKSGILNIRSKKNSLKLVPGKEYVGIPVKTEYKYLGVWFDEVINPLTHLSKSKKKIDYLTKSLKVIPKKSVTPKLLINLWSLIVRPIFDYAICIAQEEGTLKLETYIRLERSSLKTLLGLRCTTANTVVDVLMGYDSHKYAAWLSQNATAKWNYRCARRREDPSNAIDYHMKASNLIITWPLLKMNNMLFHQCSQHETLLTPSHLLSEHEVQIPSIVDVATLGYGIEKKLKSKVAKDKGDTYELIDRTVENHRELYEKLFRLNM
jgi:hypothetical protein